MPRRPDRRHRQSRRGARQPREVRGDRRRSGDLHPAGAATTGTSTSANRSSCSPTASCRSSRRATTRTRRRKAEELAPDIARATRRIPPLAHARSGAAARLVSGDDAEDARAGRREHDRQAPRVDRRPDRLTVRHRRAGLVPSSPRRGSRRGPDWREQEDRNSGRLTTASRRHCFASGATLRCNSSSSAQGHVQRLRLRARRPRRLPLVFARRGGPSPPAAAPRHHRRFAARRTAAAAAPARTSRGAKPDPRRTRGEAVRRPEPSALRRAPSGTRWRLVVCVVDAQATATHVMAVQSLDCGGARIVVGELHESETTGTPGLAIRPDPRLHDRTHLREQRRQLFFGGGETQITHKRGLRHKPSFRLALAARLPFTASYQRIGGL